MLVAVAEHILFAWSEAVSILKCTSVKINDYAGDMDHKISQSHLEIYMCTITTYQSQNWAMYY